MLVSVIVRAGSRRRSSSPHRAPARTTVDAGGRRRRYQTEITDAADPHVRSDGREVETGKRGRKRTRATQGASLSSTEALAPRHLSTLPERTGPRPRFVRPVSL